jgi:sialic acid synthase
MSDTRPVPRVIAEIGCNHAGDLDTALRMVEVAAGFCGVDVVKFQKRHPRTLLSPSQFDAPHPDSRHAFGKTYGEHREFLEFGIEQHRQLKAAAERAGVAYSASVWDMPSAREIIELEPDFIKVPSATNLHRELLSLLCDGYAGDVHVSLGMTSRLEEEGIVTSFIERGQQHRLVLYACTSGYPVPFEDLALLEVERLKRTYGSVIKAVGFSGHHLGIAADVAAMTLGAMFIERHFTLDRTMKGTDHAASLEPDGMRRLTRDLRNVALALTYKERDVLPIEEAQREKLKWRPPA